ncbi:trypsin-like peptidase domain-containing protein [Candidatus Pacearchaeota archaeon]|nr:trypsin-like peptidase domain-containing protein [Candidatus Pacearchaeota archaeon]
MDKKAVFFIGIVFLFLVTGVFAYSSLNSKINNLENNKAFSKNSALVTNSTVLILVETDTANINDKTSGLIYVDEKGNIWSKGTAFSVGDGMFLTASHVLENLNGKNIKLVWNGNEYDNIITEAVSLNGIDFMMFKANLPVPPLKIIERKRALVGAKIGFVGFPLNEVSPMLHEGVISSVKEVGEGAFFYNINSFVNRGNSGGPVFLSDTGEIIGIISSRQNEGILIPDIDDTSFTEGEKALLGIQMIMVQQLTLNSQVGIGNVVGIYETAMDKIIDGMNDGSLQRSIQEGQMFNPFSD